MDVVNRHYQVLLADPGRDPAYTEGNSSGGYPVFGSAGKFLDGLFGLFGASRLSIAGGLQEWPVMHYNDTTIVFSSARDREIPNKPRCFGHIDLIGRRPNVDAISKMLTNHFPGIDKLVKDTPYQ